MPSPADRLASWNRRLHIYLGLYFLVFLWLFALTGLMLNHGQWAVSLAANNRTDERYERAIEAPAGATDLERAQHVMDQLGLVGEIDLPAQQPGSFVFNTSRPADANQVRIDLASLRAAVRHFENGSLGRFRILHTFSGSRYNQPASERDWIVTTAWVIAMDAIALGLVAIIVGSYYMWWRRRARRLPGLLALLAGFIACAWFVAGL